MTKVAKRPTSKMPSKGADIPNGTQLPGSDVKFGVEISRGFTRWLASQNASIAITTYQVGKIIFFGVDPEDNFWTYNRNIGRCLGIGVDPAPKGKPPQGFWVSSDIQFYRFENLLPEGAAGVKGADALYAPRMSYFPGDLDIHDVALDGDGRPVFVNTLFNCLARPSASHSFEPIWKPEFISRLAAEDRCHLNGLAMVDGAPGYVTTVSQSDTFDGWRDGRKDQGVVIDVRTDEIVCSGLSMPHSPRWHDGKLWLHDSGRGRFGHVDLEKKTFVPLAFCPGYLRGLAFIGDIAVVGLSLPRDNKTFAGLDLDDELAARKVEPRRGLYFIDTKSGDIVHSLILEGIVTELYDVAVFPGIRQPSALGPASEETRRMLSIPVDSAK